jgi:hypothetical protein
VWCFHTIAGKAACGIQASSAEELVALLQHPSLFLTIPSSHEFFIISVEPSMHVWFFAGRKITQY